jgi:hypothetical protein
VPFCLCCFRFCKFLCRYTVKNNKVGVIFYLISRQKSLIILFDDFNDDNSHTTQTFELISEATWRKICGQITSIYCISNQRKTTNLSCSHMKWKLRNVFRLFFFYQFIRVLNLNFVHVSFYFHISENWEKEICLFTCYFLDKFLSSFPKISQTTFHF